MSIETWSGLEMKFESKKEVVDCILKNFPSLTEAELSTPVGDEQTTLNQFLENANDGSEWTDPHGFKINIIGNEFRITIN